MAPIPRRPLPGQPSASKAPRKPSVQVAPSAVTPRLAPRLWRSTASGSPLTRRGAAPSHAVGATRRSPTRPLPWTSDTPGRVWAPSSVASCSTPCPRARAAHGGRMARRLGAASRARKPPGAHAGDRAPPRGLCCSGHAGPARARARTKGAGQGGAQACHRQRAASPGAHTRPGGLWPAHTTNSLGAGARPAPRREQRGGARRRTRHCRDAPDQDGGEAEAGGGVACGGPSRPALPAPRALRGRALWLWPQRRLTASDSRGRPLPRAWASRASARGAASPGRRTGGGDDIMARSQRMTALRLCHRYARDDGTARRVWCRHTAWAVAHSNHVRTRHRMLSTPGPWKAEKKAKNRSEGEFVS
jgi:hypothetical protein